MSLHRHKWLIIGHLWSIQPPAHLPFLEVGGWGGGTKSSNSLITWLALQAISPHLRFPRCLPKVTSLTREKTPLLLSSKGFGYARNEEEDQIYNSYYKSQYYNAYPHFRSWPRRSSPQQQCLSATHTPWRKWRVQTRITLLFHHKGKCWYWTTLNSNLFQSLNVRVVNSLSAHNRVFLA